MTMIQRPRCLTGMGALAFVLSLALSSDAFANDGNAVRASGQEAELASVVWLAEDVPSPVDSPVVSPSGLPVESDVRVAELSGSAEPLARAPVQGHDAPSHAPQAPKPFLDNQSFVPFSQGEKPLGAESEKGGGRELVVLTDSVAPEAPAPVTASPSASLTSVTAEGGEKASEGGEDGGVDGIKKESEDVKDLPNNQQKDFRAASVKTLVPPADAVRHEKLDGSSSVSSVSSVSPSAGGSAPSPVEEKGKGDQSKDELKVLDEAKTQAHAQAHAHATTKAEDVVVPPTPQEEAIALAKPASSDMADVVGSIDKTPSADSVEGAGHWTAARGETLHAVLSRWSEQAGVQLVWTSQYDFPLQASIALDGNFENAVRTVLGAFANASPRPVGRLHRQASYGARVLIVQTRGNRYGE